MTNRTEQKLFWTLVVVAAAVFGGCVLAQDRPVSTAFYFNLTTAVSGGTFTNADSAPTWSLLKNGSTVVTTGTFTVAGTGTLAADYYGSLTLNSGSWTVGDTYAIEATGTISAVPVKSIVQQGFVLPAFGTTGYPPVDVAKWSNTGSITTGGIVNTGSISTGSFSITNGFTSGTLSTGTATIGTLSITNGIGAASLNIAGNATFSQIVTSGAQFGTTTFSNLNITTLTALNAGIGTTTPASGAAWINGTLLSVSDSAAQAILNTQTSGLTTAGGFANTLISNVVIRSGTLQGGASGSVTLDASASSVTDFYMGRRILLTGNTGAGQSALIYGYNGTTKVALTTPDWATTPTGTTTFSIQPQAKVYQAGPR